MVQPRCFSELPLRRVHSVSGAAARVRDTGPPTSKRLSTRSLEICRRCRAQRPRRASILESNFCTALNAVQKVLTLAVPLAARKPERSTLNSPGILHSQLKKLSPSALNPQPAFRTPSNRSTRPCCWQPQRMPFRATRRLADRALSQLHTRCACRGRPGTATRRLGWYVHHERLHVRLQQ